MTVTYEGRRGDTWEDRITQVISMTESALNVVIPNPRDVTCNVVCNGCGRVAGGTIEQAPEGWRLGRFGENDYCPECAGKRSDSARLNAALQGSVPRDITD